jgi:hypothetical protein
MERIERIRQWIKLIKRMDAGEVRIHMEIFRKVMR